MNRIQKALKKNVDDSESEARFNSKAPTADYIAEFGSLKSLLNSMNFMIILSMICLSFIIIYSLMISDVNEQTY